jgi:hypothetical protein
MGSGAVAHAATRAVMVAAIQLWIRVGRNTDLANWRAAALGFVTEGLLDIGVGILCSDFGRFGSAADIKGIRL